MFVNTFFRSTPAISIPVTIILNGPIMLPTDDRVFPMISGNLIFVKNRNTPANTEIIFIFNKIFFKLISVSPLILHLQWVQMKNN